MSGLREELERIAEQAPRVMVPADTWRRGQRARRRSAALSAGAVVAVLALVAGLAGVLGGLPGREVVPADGGGSGAAVPSYIWSVPERMAVQGNDEQWTGGEVETDLAIGRGAAAYVMRDGLPVVIDADDGDYHLLDLPDSIQRKLLSRTSASDGTTVALSPDGRLLAYAWAGPAPESDETPMPSGVRVVTLETGAIRTVPIPGGRGTLVTDIGWSPDSRWIVWAGRQMIYWTDSSTGGSDPAAGRIGPGATTSQAVPLRGEQPTVAVADTGVVAVLDANRLVRWDREVLSRTRLRTGAAYPLGAFAPGGRSLSLGTWSPRRHAPVLDLASERIGLRPLDSPDDLYRDGAEVRPLGWVDDELMVAQVTPVDTESTAERQIVVMTRERGYASTYRIVARTDAEIAATSLTVAVDLMTLDRPTRERPEPDWPWSTERWMVVGTLTGFAALVLVLALLGWPDRSLRGRFRGLTRAAAAAR